MARMKYHYKATQHKANFISLVCFLLFVTYSILLYIKHQYGVVAMTYFVESELLTSDFSPSATWISALLGTLLCVIPAIVLTCTLHFPLRMKALAFLPSYIILGFLTGISPASVSSSANEVHLVVPLLMLLGSIVLIIFSQVYHEDRGEHAPTLNYLSVNVLISCIGMLSCIALTNTDRELHVQLAMSDALQRNDSLQLERLAYGETTTNRNITSIQIMDLSRREQLAERLFSIHGLSGSQSMLPDTMPATQVFHTSSLVYGYLGSDSIACATDVVSFLEDLLIKKVSFHADTVSMTDTLSIRVLADYYLCALLLDRELGQFSSSLPLYYDGEHALPHHFREAMAIVRSFADALPDVHVSDSVVDSRYADYMMLRQSCQDNPALLRKECSRQYPNSYWNYYYLKTN